MFEKKPAYTYEDLLLAGQGKLFDEGSPKLPAPPMLMFDRFTEVNETGGKYGKGELLAELDIKDDLWFFKCHFEGDPVMPGCLGVDALWQMLGFYLAWSGYVGKGRALGCGKAKFSGEILPTANVVEYRLDIKKVIDRRLKFAVADGLVSCDGKPIYNCKDLKVGIYIS